MKKLLLVFTLLAIFFTKTLSGQCKIEITQENKNDYVILKIKHPDTLKIKIVGWNNGSSEKEIIVQQNGTYCAKVQFTNGCASDACIDVKTIRPDITCKVDIVRMIDNTGKIKLCARAANVKKFQWNTGDTSSCITPVKSGEYCVKILTQNGCENKACVTYTIPSDTCSVKIIYTPATSVFTKPSLCIFTLSNVKSLEWSTGSNEKCISPPKNGEYCVKVLFTNGCVAKECIQINNLNGRDTCTVGIVGGPSILPGINSSLCVVTTQEIKSLEWSTGSKEKCITTEKSGEYCVKVEYKNGCIAKQCVKVEVPPKNDTCKVNIVKSINPNADALPVLCALTSSPVKTIEWSTGSKEKCITVQKSGEYCVTVVFANGCKARECIKIDLNTNNNCFVEIVRKKDESSGKTYLCLESKSVIKQISWSTNDTSRCIIPNKTGEYCVKIEDRNGCVASKCIKFEMPPKNDTCKVSIVKTPSQIINGTHSLCVIASSPIKTIEWSTGSKEKCITVQKSGEYCVTVVFANGCKARECIKIDLNNTNCIVEIVRKKDESSGKTYLCVESKSVIKQISWSTNDTTTCIIPNKTGEYCVKVVTIEGCETKKCVFFNGNVGIIPSTCNISVKKQVRGNALFLCAESGSAKADSSIIWSTGVKGKCIEIKQKGRYCAQVSVNGCEARACVTIESIGPNGLNETDEKTNSLLMKDDTEAVKNLKILGYGPNPSEDQVFVDVKAEFDHIAKMILFDLNGNQIFEQNIYLKSGHNTTQIDLSSFKNGVYQLRLLNSSDAESIKIVKAF